MNVREFAEAAGITTTAVYKKAKARGIKLAEYKDSDGNLTAEGEQVLRDLFPVTPGPELSTKLTTRVNELTAEVENKTKEITRLTAEVENLNERLRTLTEERDFLRVTLERSQHLEAAALAKVPSHPLLPAAGEEKRGLFGWFRRKRGVNHADQEKHDDNGIA